MSETKKVKSSKKLKNCTRIFIICRSLSNTIKVTTSSTTRKAGYRACTAEISNAYKIIAGKSEGKILLKNLRAYHR
jgi:hypothetical protein